VQRMWRRDFARAGEIAMSAIAVVETACLDIVGKALDQPVYRLLGGPVRDRVKAYANGWYRAERSPEAFHAAATRVVERGYRALKLDPFGPATSALERRELAASLALVEAVRDAVGPDVDLYVELHGRFTPAAAIAIARELEPFTPAWIEEPVPPENPKALARVAARVTCPIATGERIHSRHDFRELLELQCVDVLQPDLTMCGGIREVCKLAAWADVYGVLVAPHNVVRARLDRCRAALRRRDPELRRPRALQRLRRRRRQAGRAGQPGGRRRPLRPACGPRPRRRPRRGDRRRPPARRRLLRPLRRGLAAATRRAAGGRRAAVGAPATLS